ncbi:MAG: hypothetical protein LBT90_01195 [Holosporaceae bacterium]|jgi:hypothetical protein|nr:hypothetical protein [Holosporaceae bacterium]
MPQLAVETFPSQVFWVLLGFCAVYLFVSRVIAPRIEKTLENRTSHIENLENTANQLKLEAEKLEKNSSIAFENAALESAAEEKELISSFREKWLLKKGMLFDLFAKKSREDSLKLSVSADEVFNDLSNHMDDIMDAAMEGISCSLKKDD